MFTTERLIKESYFTADHQVLNKSAFSKCNCILENALMVNSDVALDSKILGFNFFLGLIPRRLRRYE